ncbi:MAG: F0F1 ATP synthase subunit alpha [Candidatus Vogelbacteria bacterium CG10_big_fil_rev_8_21_14_0_10_45_14]|uniref:ATP synthase subunit alpha n=1 Tax=Candidatus Vogelbacteria bacterium CG10_big_fil_rev_8_21_14_0_10_45_14 TaxID=1975042 RepID=A0A2H0RJJ3_9BACT|nr:MAG: F0F1 ATP synthase subunit alpha [Candidatus Vogelbacteria bacterium CG10_big_fil_rev_8_21_14_0_10_45_14]
MTTKTKENVVDVREVLASLDDAVKSFRAESSLEEVGVVVSVSDGVALATGLGKVMAGELVRFVDGGTGVTLNLEDGITGIVLLTDCGLVREGSSVERTKRILDVPVGEELLGRIVDPLGNPKDAGPSLLKVETRNPIERQAPGVMKRKSVHESLETGITAIDAIIPIGRGQRELIIGDRGTGKTSIAIDTILSQRGKDVVCIYVAIGQKAAKVAQIAEMLREEGALAYTTIVAATASDTTSLQYLAPYAGAAMGEYFMDKGQHVLIVYDDLSKHATAYRELSLLLRRPPGREAYPGDVFYLHSRLLERAAKLSDKEGAGSMTALPVIETQAGDVSAYIPTNVISITDGQIYLESGLFHRGVRPAINVGISVSRVGGAAQKKAMKKVAGKLKLDLAQFRELESFAQFGSDLDATTAQELARGKRLTEILKQVRFSPRELSHQVVMLYIINCGLEDNVQIASVSKVASGFVEYLTAHNDGLLRKIDVEGVFDDAWEKEVEAEYKKYEKKLTADVFVLVSDKNNGK